jgi:enoyl-CoA hydratase/carnithine racemase
MELKEYKFIKVQLKRNVAVIQFNRPEKKNALNLAMRTEIIEALNALKLEKRVRSVIFYGGEDFFSAGFDRDEVQAVVEGKSDYQEFVESNHLFHETILNYPKLLIAAINGFALAGAFDLAVICHIRVCSRTALFGHPEIRFGACPLFFPYMELVGRGKAIEIALNTSSKENFLNAEEAYRLHLVNKIVEPVDVLNESIKIAMEINKNPDFAVSQLLNVNKIFFNRVEAFDREIDSIVKSMKKVLDKE